MRKIVHVVRGSKKRILVREDHEDRSPYCSFSSQRRNVPLTPLPSAAEGRYIRYKTDRERRPSSAYASPPRNALSKRGSCERGRIIPSLFVVTVFAEHLNGILSQGTASTAPDAAHVAPPAILCTYRRKVRAIITSAMARVYTRHFTRARGKNSDLVPSGMERGLRSRQQIEKGDRYIAKGNEKTCPFPRTIRLIRCFLNCNFAAGILTRSFGRKEW